jgi:hypothetical protein
VVGAFRCWKDGTAGVGALRFWKDVAVIVGALCPLVLSEVICDLTELDPATCWL